MKINYKCLYCGYENEVDNDNVFTEYQHCERCEGIHDIEMNDDGQIIVEEF